MMEKYISRVLLLFILLGLITLVILAVLVVRELLAAKSDLNPQGSAYELNIDGLGKLWLSDLSSGEIWQVNPADGSYNVYSVPGFPVDARQSDGWLWWADARSNSLNRVSVSDGSYTQWQIPDAYGFLGTNLDAQGRFYATDSSNPFLYRLDPSTSTVCVLSLPGFGASNYIVRDGDYLWLADSFDSIVIRLQTLDEQLAWWSLPGVSSPFGMALDESGNLWFADQGTRSISKLNPSTDQLISYILPKGNYPQMLAIQSGAIWFTEQSLPGFGRLDPRSSDHSIISLNYSAYQVSPNCNHISPSASGTVTITSGKMSWQKNTYTPVVNSSGWQIFQLPESSNPWGIALPDLGYLVDSGQQMLLRFEPTQEPTTVVDTPGKVIPLASPIDTPKFVPTPLWSKNLSSDSLQVYLPIIIKNGLISPP